MLDGNTPRPSEAVADFQRTLIELGYNLGDWDPFAAGYPRGADGSWGSTTEARTTEFQTAFGLQPTGKGDGVTVATAHDLAARNRGSGGTVDEEARKQARAARTIAERAEGSANRANTTLDKIRSE